MQLYDVEYAKELTPEQARFVSSERVSSALSIELGDRVMASLLLEAVYGGPAQLILGFRGGVLQ